MSDNGVLYNKPKSQIYNDSLRIRRMVEAFEQANSAGTRRDDEAQPTPGRTSTRGSKGGPAAFQQAMLRIIDDLMSLEHQRYLVDATLFLHRFCFFVFVFILFRVSFLSSPFLYGVNADVLL